MADLNAVIEFDPENPDVWDERGLAFYSAGNTSAAIEDFDKAIKLALISRQDYPALFRWMSRIRAGDAELAQRELDAYFGTRWFGDDSSWSSVLVALALGKLSLEDVLKRAPEKAQGNLAGRICEARFYAGVAARGKGIDSEAMAQFEAALAANEPSYQEHELAREEIRRLREKR